MNRKTTIPVGIEMGRQTKILYKFLISLKWCSNWSSICSIDFYYWASFVFMSIFKAIKSKFNGNFTTLSRFVYIENGFDVAHQTTIQTFQYRHELGSLSRMKQYSSWCVWIPSAFCILKGLLFVYFDVIIVDFACQFSPTVLLHINFTVCKCGIKPVNSLLWKIWAASRHILKYNNILIMPGQTKLYFHSFSGESFIQKLFTFWGAFD